MNSFQHVHELHVGDLVYEIVLRTHLMVSRVTSEPVNRGDGLTVFYAEAVERRDYDGGLRSVSRKGLPCSALRYALADAAYSPRLYLDNPFEGRAGGVRELVVPLNA